MLESEGSILYLWYDVDSTHSIPIPSFWVMYALVYLALSLVLLLITVLRVRRQARR